MKIGIAARAVVVLADHYYSIRSEAFTMNGRGQGAIPDQLAEVLH
jgi:hypothetical protein